MDSRERYVRALSFEGPDRAPITHRHLAGAVRDSPSSTRPTQPTSSATVLARSGSTALDRASRAWTAGAVSGCVIATTPMDRWSGTPLPTGGLWQRMFFLRGFDALLLDLAEGCDEVIYLRDVVTNWLVKRVEILGRYDLDAMGMGDDWGWQTSLMISPVTWRRVFKPAYRKIVEAIHSTGKAAHFHTDGYTLEIIPDLIEVGFDELNPQVWCMDVAELGRRFAGKVCFRPDLDRQWLLLRGSPDDVVAYIQRSFQALSTPKGGFVCWGQIAPDVPVANAEAMLRTFWNLRY